MNLEAKKTALRMIDNGVFVLTTRGEIGCFGSTITWVTQTSFKPPLVTVALRVDSGIYQGVKESGRFVLHILQKNQASFAASFFKSSKSDETTINGHPFKLSELGNPILEDTPAFIEYNVRQIVENGDHHIVIGEVIESRVRDITSILRLSDTGWSYGG